MSSISLVKKAEVEPDQVRDFFRVLTEADAQTSTELIYDLYQENRVCGLDCAIRNLSTTASLDLEVDNGERVITLSANSAFNFENAKFSKIRVVFTSGESFTVVLMGVSIE